MTISDVILGNEDDSNVIGQVDCVVVFVGKVHSSTPRKFVILSLVDVFSLVVTNEEVEPGGGGDVVMVSNVSSVLIACTGVLADEL